MKYGLATVLSEKLVLSRSPTAEIAAAAVAAIKAGGLKEADIVVIALDPDETSSAPNTAKMLEDALRAHK